MKRSSMVLVLVALLCLPACMSFVGGPWGIPPSEFQFRPMVPLRAPGPGGWKSARATIHLMHVTPQGVRKNAWCHIEVQVPEINFRGVVTDEFAQRKCASASWKKRRGRCKKTFPELVSYRPANWDLHMDLKALSNRAKEEA